MTKQEIDNKVNWLRAEIKQINTQSDYDDYQSSCEEFNIDSDEVHFSTYKHLMGLLNFLTAPQNLNLTKKEVKQILSEHGFFKMFENVYPKYLDDMLERNKLAFYKVMKELGERVLILKSSIYNI